MYDVCFAYIDDIVWGGKDFREFPRNLDLILTRLENFGIILNPDKCKINLREIKGVGYILDATGLRFSEDKLEGVRILDQVAHVCIKITFILGIGKLLQGSCR